MGESGKGGLLSNPKRFLLRLVMQIAAIVVGFLVLFGGIIFFLQDRMIYFPRPYDENFKRTLPVGMEVEELTYSIPAGKQTAFYLPTESGEKPQVLWVLFHGNASLAINWVYTLEDAPRGKTGYLLVDFPGYGLSEGKPNPRSIRQTGKAAFAAWKEKMDVSEGESEQLALGGIGFSLGAAAVLQFAADHPVERLILFAPFTSMNEMAILSAGRPMNLLLRHHFNNRKRLEELSERPKPPRIDLFQGTDDEVIPPRMGKELAESFPGMITFHRIPGAGHNDLGYVTQDQLIELLEEAEKETGD